MDSNSTEHHKDEGKSVTSSGIVCSNCGGSGHVYRLCTHPVSSYGIICFRLVVVADAVRPQYLMVQRKDSLGFVEFVRGKYDTDDLEYIGAMLGNMTREERDKVLHAAGIEVLWEHLWRDMSTPPGSQPKSVNKPAFIKDFEDARAKYLRIQGRLHELLRRYPSEIQETEWGFPKGRRNMNESDIDCAFREFQEETGLSHRHLKLAKDLTSVEELFRGSNGVCYRHCYFVAKASPKLLATCGADGSYQHVNGEIRAVQWFDYDACMRKIRDAYPQRRDLLRRVHDGILDGLFNVNVAQLVPPFVQPSEEHVRSARARHWGDGSTGHGSRVVFV
jgi:8-oxo-dGTP pyrophosphatase MutT (NUDIX family)